MSSTQMDFSPQFINRKQDIASWPEGDIDQLTTKDKNRYQKRKRAILDYFQSDLLVAEISGRHRLSAADGLEAMARRCCTLHEDGQQWGFRALVPGVKVVAPPTTVPKHTRASEVETAASRRAKLFALEAELATQGAFVSAEESEDDDTVERAAIVLTKVAQLPQTPIPASLEERSEPPAQVPFAEPDAPAVKQAAFPATTGEEVSVDDSVVQLAFPPAGDGSEKIVDEAVAQEEFPAISDLDREDASEVEIKQEEFPTSEPHMDKEQEQEGEGDSAEIVDHAEAIGEVEQEARGGQEELAAVVKEVEVEAQEEGRVDAQSEEEEGAEKEAQEEERVDAQNEEEEEDSSEIVQKEFAAQTSAIPLSEVNRAEDEEFDAEPTSKLSRVVVEVEQDLIEGEKASAAVESLPTSEPAETTLTTSAEETEHSEEADERAEGNAGEAVIEATEEADRPEEIEPEQHEVAEASTEEAGEQEGAKEIEEADGREESNVSTEDKPSQVVGTESQSAEQSTGEIAKAVAEERLNRVAATATIKVPAAMLDALEKADQELQARTEEATASAPSPEATAAEPAGADSDALPQSAETPTGAAEVVSKDEVAEIPTQTLEGQRRDSHPLPQVSSTEAPTKSLVAKGRYYITGSQVALKHTLLRRWGRKGRQQKYRRWMRIASAAMIVSILVILLIPLGVGLAGYNAYTNIKNVANDGVNNLLTLKDLVPADKNDLLSALNTQKLATAKTNLQKAQDDFLQLQDLVNRPDVESLLQQFAPQYSDKLDMARHLVQVALDVSRMGQELIGVAQMGANVLHSSGSLLSSNSTQPLFSADDVNTVEATLVHAQYYVNDIQRQMGQVDLAELPFGSASQKAELAKYLTQIPQAQSAITQAQSLVGPVAWMLGVGQTRHFLVQTLDRGELRPSGGFEGQYGILTLQNGRMSPFSLKDITGLDYASNGAELGAIPPSQYSWMNFGNFGVRDANLSADYPTTAKIVMSYFQQEGGGPVDGVVQITPVIIKQFLQITGPLKIPEYHETITAQNLEDKLHQYQQDPRFISEQQQITGSDTKSTRKAFTNLVGTLLMDRIKKLPPTQMISFGKILLTDLKTRDLQVYLSNPVAEQWLTQNGYNGAMPRYTNGVDGFMVVQSNISISKAAQYVKTTFKDNVTLDAQGGATHNLQIMLNYQQTGPVYGYNTYANYMRIYAPANAQLISAYGFNTGSVLCTPGKSSTNPKNSKNKGNGSSGGAAYTDAGVTVAGCGQYYNTFPDTNARNCPDGDYRLGYDGMAAKAWPVQNLGGPSTRSSDLSGYAMWAGLTLTPKNCITTVTLSWYVPHIVQKTAGQAPYQMIVGHQAGWPDNAQISIDASALKGVKSLKYGQTIDVDTLVALAPRSLPPSRQKPGSTPTPAVTPTAAVKKP